MIKARIEDAGDPKDRRQASRQPVEIGIDVARFLAALVVDRLHEIALPVEQSESDEWEVEVARGLAVVAREDAEAAGVVRDAFMEAELGGKIREGTALEGRFGAQLAVGVLARHVGVEKNFLFLFYILIKQCHLVMLLLKIK